MSETSPAPQRKDYAEMSIPSLEHRLEAAAAANDPTVNERKKIGAQALLALRHHDEKTLNALIEQYGAGYEKLGKRS